MAMVCPWQSAVAFDRSGGWSPLRRAPRTSETPLDRHYRFRLATMQQTLPKSAELNWFEKFDAHVPRTRMEAKYLVCPKFVNNINA